MTSENDDLYASLAALGEAEVRRRLAGKIYGERKKPLVEEWLRSHSAANEESISERRHASESALLREANAVALSDNALAREANNLAREANSLASDALKAADRAEKRAHTANKIAIIAALIAVTAIVIPYLWAPKASPVSRLSMTVSASSPYAPSAG